MRKAAVLSWGPQWTSARPSGVNPLDPLVAMKRDHGDGPFEEVSRVGQYVTVKSQETGFEFTCHESYFDPNRHLRSMI